LQATRRTRRSQPQQEDLPQRWMAGRVVIHGNGSIHEVVFA